VSGSVVITIPMMPPAELSPNARVHWRERAGWVKVFRACAYYTTLAATDPGEVATPAVMDIAVHWCCGRRRMDDDNLVAACKAARDGVADALWGHDADVRVGTVTQTRGEGVTIITLRDAG
jgi:crossover junction endodeoxyribonuclease RusA